MSIKSNTCRIDNHHLVRSPEKRQQRLQYSTTKKIKRVTTKNEMIMIAMSDQRSDWLFID